MMETLWQDMRYGARTLAKSPGFALVAALSLALGIGANTAIFSLTQQILLANLPVERPEELVVLRSPGPKRGMLTSDTDNGAQSFSYPAYRDLRERSTVFAGLLTTYPLPLSVAGEGSTERGNGVLVSGNYFEVLGVTAAVGRTLTAEDETAPGANPVVVLSHGYWQRRFGGNASILNRTLLVNNHPLTVVGVARGGFTGVQPGEMPELFIPITMKAQMTPNWDGLNSRRDYWLAILGRLKPGVTRQQAEAALASTYRPVVEEDLRATSGISGERRERFLSKKLELLDGSGGRRILRDGSRQPLLILTTLVGLVLLIACANIANLLVARGVARQREIAVRMAMGAGRWRLVRQLLAESLSLALLGGVAGVLVAAWTLDVLLSSLPANAGFSGITSRLNVNILAFNFGLAVLTGLLFGLIPALRATRPDLVTALKDQATGASLGRSHVRLRKGLVATQIALTAALVVTAGLFTRSLSELQSVDVGLRKEGKLTFSISPELNGYDPARTIQLLGQLQEDLAALPGVAQASFAEVPILADSNSGSNITVEGYRGDGQDGDFHSFQNWIAPEYFSMHGIPLLMGREFTRADRADAPLVAIINETMAKRCFPDGNALGRRFGFGGGNAIKMTHEIVGVVKDSKHATLREERRDFVYLPYAQHKGIGQATFYLRTTGDPLALANAVRKTVQNRDANLPVYGLKTLQAQIKESLVADRLMTILSACFGALAALLASMGLYGVMAYTVARRTREIGIRMAMGANRANVQWLVMREAVVLAAIGLAVGLPGGVGLGKLAESIVFGVKATDPLLLVAAGSLLAAVVTLAGFLPARAAAQMDPVKALRYE